MKRTGSARLLAVFAVAGMVLAACSGGSGASASVASKGTVKIAINEWVGAEANVAVVKNLLGDDRLHGRDPHPGRRGRLAGLRHR